MDMSLSEFRELVMDREAWGAAIHGVANWTELNLYLGKRYLEPIDIYMIQEKINIFFSMTCKYINKSYLLIQY